MVDCVGTGSQGITLTALAVISIVGLKCAPPRVDGVGGFETVSQEDIKDEIIDVVNLMGNNMWNLWVKPQR